MLDASIPCTPSEPGVEFMIYARGGSGYFAKPGGARIAFSHRTENEMVPVLEIEKTLAMLRIAGTVFWSTEAGCQASSKSEESTSESCLDESS